MDTFSLNGMRESFNWTTSFFVFVFMVYFRAVQLSSALGPSTVFPLGPRVQKPALTLLLRTDIKIILSPTILIQKLHVLNINSFKCKQITME
jgi:hypothetical protein